MKNSREIVQKINNFASKERVLFTFIDGDVTDVSYFILINRGKFL